MAARLRSSVRVTNPETGRREKFEAGRSDYPDWVAKALKDDRAVYFEDDDGDEEVPVEERSVQENLEAGRPVPGSVPVTDPHAEETAKVLAKAKLDELADSLEAADLGAEDGDDAEPSAEPPVKAAPRKSTR